MEFGNWSPLQCFIVFQQAVIYEGFRYFVGDKWPHDCIKEFWISTFDIGVELMAYLFIVNWKLYLLWVSIPVENPIVKFKPFQGTKISNLLKANSTPSTVPDDLSGFTCLHMIYFPWHGPSWFIILFCNSNMSEIFLGGSSLSRDIVLLEKGIGFGEEIKLTKRISMRNGKFKNISLFVVNCFGRNFQEIVMGYNIHIR